MVAAYLYSGSGLVADLGARLVKGSLERFGAKPLGAIGAIRAGAFAP